VVGEEGDAAELADSSAALAKRPCVVLAVERSSELHATRGGDSQLYKPVGKQTTLSTHDE
jgi:hypothetical protein